jgi:hypothetical protein
MKNLINKIENLENKQDNGTITMCEENQLCKLIELAEKFLSK